jgi:hypothetical protein
MAAVMSRITAQSLRVWSFVVGGYTNINNQAITGLSPGTVSMNCSLVYNK